MMRMGVKNQASMSEYVRVCQSEVNGFVNAMALRPHLDVVAVNIDVTTMETAADIPGQKNHAKRESCPNHKSTTFNNSL